MFVVDVRDGKVALDDKVTPAPARFRQACLDCRQQM